MEDELNIDVYLKKKEEIKQLSQKIDKLKIDVDDMLWDEVTRIRKIIRSYCKVHLPLAKLSLNHIYTDNNYFDINLDIIPEYYRVFEGLDEKIKINKRFKHELVVVFRYEYIERTIRAYIYHNFAYGFLKFESDKKGTDFLQYANGLWALEFPKIIESSTIPLSQYNFDELFTNINNHLNAYESYYVAQKLIST